MLCFSYEANIGNLFKYTFFLHWVPNKHSVITPRSIFLSEKKKTMLSDLKKTKQNKKKKTVRIYVSVYPLGQWKHYADRVKRIWYLSPMRAAKVQASLRIRAVSPEPSLLAHTRSESRGTFRQKARSLAPLNGWACAIEICHDGMLEDTNSLDGAQLQWFLEYLTTFQSAYRYKSQRIEKHAHLKPIFASESTLLRHLFYFQRWR